MARSVTDRKARRQERRRRREKRREMRPPSRHIPLKIVLCCVVFACLFVPAIFVNNAIGYIPAVAFLFLMVVSLLYLLIARRSLHYEEPRVRSMCVRGDALDFTVRIVNRSPLLLLRVEPTFFVSDIFGNEDQLTRSTLSLTPFEKYDFDFDVRFDHIGSYTAGLSQMVIYDLLGLFSVTIKSGSRHVIEVEPRVVDVGALTFDRELLKERSDSISPLSMDGADYTGVRDYVIGDPMKSIHWKLSARGDVYYTKIFETIGTPGVEAILDFHSPHYEPEDMMSVFDAVVEGGLSVGAYAHAQGMEFDLVYRDKNFRDVRIAAQSTDTSRASFINDLPRITDTEREREMLDLLLRESNSSYAQRNIVICTTNINEELITMLLAAKQRRRNPVLIAVVPPSMDKETRREFLRPLKRLESAKISHMSVCAADEIGGEAS